jgi:hypothetical protein
MKSRAPLAEADSVPELTLRAGMDRVPLVWKPL